MSAVEDARDRVICTSPLERPDPGLVAAAYRAGALGVLDLGHDRPTAERALRAIAGTVRELCVRVHDADIELPPHVRTVIVSEPALAASFAGRRVLAEVTSLDEARAAISAGANGVIGKGHEAGGRI